MRSVISARRPRFSSSKLLNTTPESWLRMQAALDLWQAREHSSALAKIKPLKQDAAMM